MPSSPRCPHGFPDDLFLVVDPWAKGEVSGPLDVPCERPSAFFLRRGELLHSGVGFRENLVRASEFFFRFAVLAVLATISAARVLLGDFLKARRVGDEFLVRD